MCLRLRLRCYQPGFPLATIARIDGAGRLTVYLTDGTAARLACGLKTKFHPPLTARLNDLVAQARG